MKNSWASFSRRANVISNNRACLSFVNWSYHIFSQWQGVSNAGCSLRHMLSRVSIWLALRKNFALPDICSVGERCLLWESGEQHHIVRPWSSLFKGTLRLIDIMGKNTKESKEIEKVQVQIQVQSVPDGGWGWSVCLAGFIAQFVVLGIQNNTGILYKALLEEFKQSKGETGTVWQLCLIWLQSSIFKRSVSLLSLWTRCWELLFRSKCHLNCGCYLNNKKQLKIRCVVSSFVINLPDFTPSFYADAISLKRKNYLRHWTNFFGRNREITGYVKPANNFFALNQQRRP